MRSLRVRLLSATLVALGLALLLAGWVLAELFREHVQRQFEAQLLVQLDQVTARFEPDAEGRPALDTSALSDPRWSRPYGGLYWQLDRLQPGQAPQQGVLRSRSLWDSVLKLPADRLEPARHHVHTVPGPDGQPVLVLERLLRTADGASEGTWRLLVAGDLQDTEAAVRRFSGVLLGSLAALGGLLMLAAWAQVAVGLAPLRALQRALAAVHGGQTARLDGRFPSEVQPLVDDFNAVLDRQAQSVVRARTQAGNLAHAVKTPLAVLRQAAAEAGQRPDGAATLPAVVQEQVAQAQRQVDWHLARARAAAVQGLPGVRCAVAPVLGGLKRVLDKVHANRALQLEIDDTPADLAFAGEAQDLQELLGNLLDNACHWARGRVRARAEAVGPRLRLTVDDDGPGIAPGQRARVLSRGARLDESVPGSGLGLAIVADLVALYGGTLRLDGSPAGGLRAVVELPRASGDGAGSRARSN
jgi:signal transduction histidine kinase